MLIGTSMEATPFLLLVTTIPVVVVHPSSVLPQHIMCGVALHDRSMAFLWQNDHNSDNAPTGGQVLCQAD